MMERLANFLFRYGKIVLALWVVVTLIFVPLAVGSFQHYGNSFNSQDSETEEGEQIIEKYFEKPDWDLYEMPLLVINYESGEAYEQINSPYGVLTEFVRSYFTDPDVSNPDFVEEWALKLDSSKSFNTIIEVTDDTQHGIYVIEFVYGTLMTDSEIDDDVPNLRHAISQMIDAFVFQAHGTKALFGTYLTGTNVIYHDSDVAIQNTSVISIIVIVIFVVILAGLFLGSVMSTIIMASTTVISLIVSMGFTFMINYFHSLPLVFVGSMVVVVIAITFTQSVYIITTYRNELLSSKNDKPGSLSATVCKCGTTIFEIGLCLFVCCLLMTLIGNYYIASLGICLMVGLVVSVLVSLLVTPSLIGLTKNELFWTNNSNDKIKWKPMRFIYKKAGKAFSKIYHFMEHISLRTSKIIAVSVVALTLVSAVYVATSSPFNDESTDLTASFTVGESDEGLEILEKYSCGGLINPYDVAIEYKNPVGTVVRNSVLIADYYELHWNMEMDFDELYALRDKIKSSDPDNISFVCSPESWDYLVDYAKTVGGKSDYGEIIDYILYDYLPDENPVVASALEQYIDYIRSVLSDEIIVDSGAPIIDYVMNVGYGTAGYHMVSSGDLIVTHVAFLVGTKLSSTAMRTMTTTDNLDRAVSDFVSKSSDMKDYWIIGSACTYGNIARNVFQIYFPILISMFAAAILILAFIYRSVSTALITVLVTLVSLILSLAIMRFVLYFSEMESMSLFVLLIAPVFSLSFGLWFGHISISTFSEKGPVRKARKNLTPLILITVATTVVACIPFMCSGVAIVAQTGAVFALIATIDVFVIRILLSPALWKLNKTYLRK